MGRVSRSDFMSRKTCSTCQSSLYLRVVCSAVSVVFVLSTHFPSYRASSSILAWLIETVSRSSFKYFQRLAKRQRIEAAICKKNDYLAAHERARVSTAVDNIAAMIKNLKIDSWLKVQSDQRHLSLLIDELLWRRIPVWTAATPSRPTCRNQQ